MSLAPEAFDEGIDAALAALGEFSEVDRSYAFQLSSDGVTMDNTHEWCAPGVDPELHNLQRLPVEGFPWLMGRLREGAAVAVPRVADLPPEAAAERRELEREGVRSCICVPLESAGTLIGFLGFDTVRRERTWSESHVELLRSVGGILVGAVNHKRTRRELRESRSDLDRTQDAANVGVWSWQIALDQVTFSTQCFRIFGMDPETFGGSFAECMQAIHPDDLSQVEAITERALTEKRSFPTEFRILRSSGEARLVRANADVFLDRDGEVERMVGIVQDITEQRDVEEKQRRLSAAMEQVDEAVLITDAKGIVSYVNAAFERLTGYAGEEALGSSTAMLRDRDGGASAFAEMRSTLARGDFWAGRLNGRRKDGTSFLTDTTVSPVQDAHGSIVSYVAVQRDVTRDVALEEQLRNVQKMEAVGMLAGGIAHDFNNLLIAIIGHSDLLLMKSEDEPEVHRHATEIRKAGERARALTSQLLAFGRKQVMRPRALDLGEVLSDVESLVQRVIGEDVELVLERADTTAMVMADPGQMEQVILNLVTNAREAMPAGGTLNLRLSVEDLDAEACTLFGTRDAGRHVLLTVRDTGLGMSEETRARIFEPFFTTKGVRLGTGLGLATVYGIVHQNGGGIRVRSEVGAGTTFEICLPFSHEEAATREYTPTAPPGTVGHETILVAEDEPLVASIVKSTLRAHGYTVLYAENGEQALDVAAAHEGSIDLLFTDVVMPKMGGVTLAEKLKAQRPGLRVLYSSGYTDSALTRRGALIEGVELLQKPYAPAALVERVRRTLDDGRPGTSLTGT